jgi:hypothetical protein
VKVAAEEKALINQVSSDRLMEFTQRVTRYVRLSGSREEREAFRYIAERLRGWGFEIEEHRAECWTSWPVSASLEILGESPQPIPCITHAMAASTPPEGIVLDLVDVGSGDDAALGRQSPRGHAAVCGGLAMPATVSQIERAGALAQVYICGDQIHEMISSIVWGSPSPDTACLLPKTPVVSVNREGGAKLYEAMRRSEGLRTPAEGCARVRICAQVDSQWRSLPQLIAHLRAPRGNGDFLLFSGHVDSWHYGAMDNGSANATQLEVARIMASRRRFFRRDLRLAFWSGHSHSRYAGSAWYADNFWQDLYDHCVLHLNVDSVGAKGASLLSEAIVMDEVRDFASAIVEKVAGQRLSGVRPSRAGDQSFWGHGIPSLFMTLSEQPADDSETARAYSLLMGGAPRSGGLGWWWHTPEDTLDKLDPMFLARDAQVYLLATQRTLEDPILPLDYRSVVVEAREVLRRYDKEAKGRFDLSPVDEALENLSKCLNAFYRRIRSVRLTHATAERANACIKALGRELIPINYCRAERFDHDTTLAVPPFPGLEPMRRLGQFDPDSDEARQLCVALVRGRNKVCYHLGRAQRHVEAALAHLPKRGVE